LGQDHFKRKIKPRETGVGFGKKEGKTIVGPKN